MGSDLRRWLADRLPAEVSSGERLVALEAADCAWDSTRIARQGDLLEVITRRAGYRDAKQVGKVLGKLAGRGIELRLPVRGKDGEPLTDKNGRTIYACRGHELELRIPTEEECPALLKLPPAGDLQSSPERETKGAEAPLAGGPMSPEAPPPGGAMIPKGPPPGPKGPPPGPQSSPGRGTPTPKTTETPTTKETLSASDAEPSSLTGDLVFDNAGKPVAAKAPAEDLADFGAFWLVYPKRRDREAAIKAWRAAVARGADPQRIIAAATAYANERVSENPKYTKYPATWLNKGCYDDEPDPQRPPLRAVSGGYQPFRNPTDDSVWDEPL